LIGIILKYVKLTKHDDASVSPINAASKKNSVKSPTNSLEAQLKNDLMSFSSPI